MDKKEIRDKVIFLAIIGMISFIAAWYFNENFEIVRSIPGGSLTVMILIWVIVGSAILKI